MADVLGVTVHQVADPVVANARGAALLAAIGIGELDWADVPDRVAVAATFTPDPSVRAVHDRQYAAFRDIYRRTHRLYARHNAASAVLGQE
jgi:xylulokinase